MSFSFSVGLFLFCGFFEVFRYVVGVGLVVVVNVFCRRGDLFGVVWVCVWCFVFWVMLVCCSM